tara:strand:- start:1902 stop:3374 length:1473 start_codon:yes stop_codon:yes gene_type:complete
MLQVRTTETFSQVDDSYGLFNKEDFTHIWPKEEISISHSHEGEKSWLKPENKAILKYRLKEWESKLNIFQKKIAEKEKSFLQFYQNFLKKRFEQRYNPDKKALEPIIKEFVEKSKEAYLLDKTFQKTIDVFKKWIETNKNEITEQKLTYNDPRLTRLKQQKQFFENKLEITGKILKEFTKDILNMLNILDKIGEPKELSSSELDKYKKVNDKYNQVKWLSDTIQKEYNKESNTLIEWRKTNSSELKEMENEELLNKTKKREKDIQVENKKKETQEIIDGAVENSLEIQTEKTKILENKKTEILQKVTERQEEKKNKIYEDTEKRKSNARTQLPNINKNIRTFVYSQIFEYLKPKIITQAKLKAEENINKGEALMVRETKKITNDIINNHKDDAIAFGYKALNVPIHYFETVSKEKEGPFHASGILEKIGTESKLDKSTIEQMTKGLTYIPASQFRIAKNNLIDYSINELVNEAFKQNNLNAKPLINCVIM